MTMTEFQNESVRADFNLGRGDALMSDDLKGHPLVRAAQIGGRITGDAKADNNLRAGWAANTVLFLAKMTGADELGAVITDLVTDLMHLADATGLDFETIYNKAEFQYGDEIL